MAGKKKKRMLLCICPNAAGGLCFFMINQELPNTEIESLLPMALSVSLNISLPMDESIWASLRVYDWDFEPLPSHTLVSQVPRPGIFLALIENSNSSTLPAALLMKAQSSNYPDVQNFLRDPASSYDPDPLTTNDVFIGYGGEDEEWAKELYKQLEGAGLKCFLAKLNIPTGAVWTERLREELLSSRLGLLLLTRNSFDRPWLMCEAGALWATGTPIVPAYRYIQLTEVPDIISKHQARKIETQSEQEALISELEQQLRG
jgi:hypothetical protein